MSFMTRHLWVNHHLSDSKPKEKGLINKKKTEEEDKFNGLGRKRIGGRRNIFKSPRKRLFQITGDRGGYVVIAIAGLHGPAYRYTTHNQ